MSRSTDLPSRRVRATWTRCRRCPCAGPAAAARTRPQAPPGCARRAPPARTSRRCAAPRRSTAVRGPADRAPRSPRGHCRPAPSAVRARARASPCSLSELCGCAFSTATLAWAAYISSSCSCLGPGRMPSWGRSTLMTPSSPEPRVRSGASSASSGCQAPTSARRRPTRRGGSDEQAADLVALRHPLVPHLTGRAPPEQRSTRVVVPLARDDHRVAVRHDEVDDGHPEPQSLEEAEAHGGQCPVEVEVLVVGPYEGVQAPERGRPRPGTVCGRAWRGHRHGIARRGPD